MKTQEYEKYKDTLPGITPDSPEEFAKLAQLIAQNVFELIFRQGRCMVIYIMSDAVESFMEFEDAKVTGEYLADWEGEQSFSLTVREQDYVLAVRQGSDNAFTIRFDRLVLHANLYDYSQIGHFWITGYEYLRQIEYQVTMLWDKKHYLGENYCTEAELSLSHLAEFPPILCYPSVPLPYRIIKENQWECSEQSIEVMAEVIRKVGDTSLEKKLEQYAKNPSKRNSRRFAKLLCKKKHSAVVDEIRNRLIHCGQTYPVRPYTEEIRQKFERAKELGEQERQRFAGKGKRTDLYWEIPFECDLDETAFTIYLMHYYGIWNRKVKIETFEVQM